MAHPTAMDQVFYKKGYVYQLSRDLVVDTGLLGYDITTPYIRLLPNGIMVLAKGYAWDGATCFPDFDWIIYGSCAHDAGYQLIRLGLIPKHCKEHFDELLGDNCYRDGAYGFVADGVETAVKKFGGKATQADSERKELCSPKKRRK